MGCCYDCDFKDPLITRYEDKIDLLGRLFVAATLGNSFYVNSPDAEAVSYMLKGLGVEFSFIEDEYGATFYWGCCDG